MIFRHNEIQDKLVSLAEKAFAPSAEPPIEPSCVKESEQDTSIKGASQEKMEQATGEDECADPLVCGFWAREAD